MARSKVARTVSPTSFDVLLVSSGAGRSNVVKAVKTITGLGLEETRALVTSAPSLVKQKVGKAEAESIKARLIAAGATVELRVHGAPAPAPLEQPTTHITTDGGVRTMPGLGLKESNEVVVNEKVGRDEPEALRSRLSETSTTVETRVRGVPAPDPASVPAPEYTVVLKDGGPAKLNVVKVVKTLTGLGLKEAKDLVDAAPSVVREKVSREEAEAIKAQLVEAGATVEIK